MSPFDTAYQDPAEKSNYTRLTEGVHVLRILSTPKEVQSYFVEYVDKQTKEGIKKEKIITPDNGDGKQPQGTRRNWAFKVYNHETKQVQVWEVAQKNIQQYLTNILRGKLKNDWTKFNLQITRTGQGLETEYTLMNGDSEPLGKEAQKIIDETYVDLTQMTLGKDPFDEDSQPAEETKATMGPNTDDQGIEMKMPF